MDSEAVPQILESRLLACVTSATNTSMFAQTSERFFNASDQQLFTSASHEERRTNVLSMASFLPPRRVSDHCSMQFRAERDQPCFMKLRLTNRHHRFLKVHIPKRKGKSFAETQAGTIKQQQQCAKVSGSSLRCLRKEPVASRRHCSSL